jgi:hypothetical protein
MEHKHSGLCVKLVPQNVLLMNPTTIFIRNILYSDASTFGGGNLFIYIHIVC